MKQHFLDDKQWDGLVDFNQFFVWVSGQQCTNIQTPFSPSLLLLLTLLLLLLLLLLLIRDFLVSLLL